MAILWHGVQRSSKVGDPDAPKLWDVQWVQRSQVDTEELARRIASWTSLSETDVLAVLHALRAEIEQALCASDSVRLDGLASFLLSVTGETGEATEEELSRVPKEADVYIRIARQIQDALDQVEFQRAA